MEYSTIKATFAALTSDLVLVVMGALGFIKSNERFACYPFRWNTVIHYVLKCTLCSSLPQATYCSNETGILSWVLRHVEWVPLNYYGLELIWKGFAGEQRRFIWKNMLKLLTSLQSFSFSFTKNCDSTVGKLVTKNNDTNTFSFVSFKICLDPSLKSTALIPETWPHGHEF